MLSEGCIKNAKHVGNNNSVIGGEAQKNIILAHIEVLFLPSKMQYVFKLCLMSLPSAPVKHYCFYLAKEFTEY